MTTTLGIFDESGPLRYCGKKHPKLDVHCVLHDGHMLHHKGVRRDETRRPGEQCTWLNWTDGGKTWEGFATAEPGRDYDGRHPLDD